MYSEITCYNKNVNFNKIFEYDNSVVLIRAVFGLRKHHKYIYPKILRHNYRKQKNKLNHKMHRGKSRFSVNKPDSV